MTRNMFLFSLIVFLTSFSGAAQALCLGVGLKNVPATVTFSGDYDPYEQAEQMQSVNFQVEVLIAALSCNYRVYLTAGNSGNVNSRRLDRAGGDDLDYNVYTTPAKTGIIKDHSAGAGDRINGSFGAVAIGAVNDHTMYWTATPAQIVSGGGGWFSDTLTLRLFQEVIVPGNFVEMPSAAITFRAQASTSMDVSLVDTGGSFAVGDTAQTIDFGTLSSGEFLAYDTIVRSNAPFKVTLQSQNAQKMKHQNAPVVPDTVDYNLAFDGAGVNLQSGNPVQATASVTPTPAEGIAYPVIFTIGNLSGAEAAGNYADVMTVTVSAP